MLNGNCKILRKVKTKGKGTRIEAEKFLRNGRLHLKISNPEPRREYILDIHFDPTKHFNILRLPPKISREMGMHVVRDCKEIRDFVRKHVTPTIRKHR